MGKRRFGKQRFTPKVLVTTVEAAVVEQALEAQEHRIKTAGGRFQVRWDENGTARALGPDFLLPAMDFRMKLVSANGGINWWRG